MADSKKDQSAAEAYKKVLKELEQIKQSIAENQPARETERVIRRPEERFEGYIESAPGRIPEAFDELKTDLISTINKTITSAKDKQEDKFKNETRERYKKIEESISANLERLTELQNKSDKSYKVVEDILKKEQESKKDVEELFKAQIAEKEKGLQELETKTPELGDYEKSQKIKKEIEDLEAQKRDQLQKLVELREQEIGNLNDDLKKDDAEMKKLNEEVVKSRKQLVKIEKDFVKEAEALNEETLDKVREQQAQLIDKTISSFKVVGKDAFEDTLKEQKDVDEGLSNYKKALNEEFEALNANIELRQKLGLTDKKMDEIKQDLYDSYFSELNRQLERKDLDEKTKTVLLERIKREQIQAGRTSFEETYGKNNALAKLVGRISDFTAERTKTEQQTGGKLFNKQGTEAAGKIVNDTLRSLFGGGNAKEPFLEGSKPTQDIGSTDIEGKEGTQYVETSFQKMEEKTKDQPVEPQKPKKVPIPKFASLFENPEQPATSQAVEIRRAETPLQEIQQILENSQENVPLKVAITNIEELGKKDLAETFSLALEAVTGSESKNRPALPSSESKEGKVTKSEEEGSFIDVVSEVLDGGSGKKKGGKGRKPKSPKSPKAPKASKGLLGGLRSAASKVPLGSGVTLGTTLGGGAAAGGAGGAGAAAGGAGAAAGGLGAAGAATVGAAIAGTILVGGAVGYGLGSTETGLKAGTGVLNAVGYNKETEEQEKINENTNAELQKASKLGSRKERDIAFFEAQLKDLNSRKALQSGDELKETEEKISKIQNKLEQIKKTPESVAKTEGPAKQQTAAPASAKTEVPSSKTVEGISALPPLNAGASESKDIKPELDTNNKLTAQIVDKLDILIKVMSSKDYSPTSVTPVSVSQTSPPTEQEAQTQSAAYRYRAQNRKD